MALYDQRIDAAFEQVAGPAGANKERYMYWLSSLAPSISRIKANPQREAEPVLALPSREDDLDEIENIATHIAQNFSTLVIAGMGGSSLSSDALLYLRKQSRLKIRFIDNTDPFSMDTLVKNLEWKDAAFFIVSKSGNTVETLAQVSVLLRHAKAKLPHYAQHFFVITMADGNPLHSLAKAHGMRIVAHDPKLGGRFSILSAVGLIPAAATGMNVRALRAGAQSVLSQNFTTGVGNAPAAQSAALHMALIEKGSKVNVMMHYCDRLGGLSAWYRQCWSESLGKCEQATTPANARGATDQHSQLQLYLDGPRDKFFTMMTIESKGQGEPIDYKEESDARLSFFKGKTFGDLFDAQQRGTIATLTNRGCPLRNFVLPQVNEETFGALLMHFTLEIMFTAELLKINAFDQPAVEDSKVLALQYLASEKAKVLNAAS